MVMSPNHNSITPPNGRKQRIGKYVSLHEKQSQERARQHVLADGHVLERDHHNQLMAKHLEKADNNHSKMD